MTMIEAEAILPLIERIYDAALNANVWPEVISKIAALHATDKAVLFTPMHAPHQGGIVFATGISETMVEQHAAKYAQHDVWTQATVEKGLLFEGSVVTDEDLYPHDALLDTVFYREFLSKQGIARVCSGVVFGSDSAGMPPAGLSVYRGLNDSAFSERERAFHAALIPHISRALGIMFRLRDAELKVASTLAGFNRLALGVMLLGRVGEVVFANDAARRMLQREVGLRIRAEMNGHSFLVADAPDEQRALAAAIQQSIGPGHIDVPHFSKVVRISRPSGGTVYTLNFSALPEHNEFGTGGSLPRAIGFLNDPDEPIRVDAKLLNRLYGLTPAECRLAVHLCSGETLASIATQLGVREPTVKTQLQSIFDKTQTRRQVHLVKLLVSLATSEAT